MITFAIEQFRNVYREMYPLLERHYEEISTHRDHGVPLSPQAHEYQRREDCGQLMMIIGRERGTIVSYVVAFIGPGLHYQTCLTSIVDIYYVDQGARGFLIGKKMFEFAKLEWKRRGVQRVAAGAKLAHDASPLLKYVGFSPVEIIHEMWLGE